MSETGNTTYVWTTTSTGAASLQEAASGSTNRVAAIWYNNTSFTVSLNATDRKVHQVAFYLYDYSPGGRGDTILAENGVTSAVFDNRAATNMTGGLYYVYNYMGNVKFVFERLSGANAIVNGVFFDP
jgi:hypothetical protein